MPAFSPKINPAMLLPEPNRLLIYATKKQAGNKPALTTAWKAMLQKRTERFGVLFAFANYRVSQNYKAKRTSESDIQRASFTKFGIPLGSYTLEMLPEEFRTPKCRFFAQLVA